MIGSKRVFDCFPLFNELDVLEIRLHEMDGLADRFVIVESAETYGGAQKKLHLKENWRRFEEFWDRIAYMPIPKLLPECTDRKTGREREAYQRNQILKSLQEFEHAKADDVIVFSDCDEIPNALTVLNAVPQVEQDGVYRLKQYQFYYDVNTLTDYGHDWGSRARVGLLRDVQRAGSMYEFRMMRKDTEAFALENGGWHFSYFGGVERIKTKVAALSPFLSEYKLFGDKELARDIQQGHDLHHRVCELPAEFTKVATGAIKLPAYLMKNQERFSHFFSASPVGR